MIVLGIFLAIFLTSIIIGFLITYGAVSLTTRRKQLKNKPNLEWKHEYPKEEGYYWFYGYFHVDCPVDTPRLIFCKVYPDRFVGGNGMIIYQKELGNQWMFLKAEVPELPKL